VDKLGETFAQTEVPLPRTPRKFVVHPTIGCLVIIETDHNTIPDKEKLAMSTETETPAAVPPHAVDEMEIDDEPEAKRSTVLDERIFGAPQGGPGKWASALRVVDSDGKTLCMYELEANEAAFSMCMAQFAGTEMFVVIGTAKDLTLHPRHCSGGFISVFRLALVAASDGGSPVRLELLHKTPTEDLALALCPFQDRLLAGIGSSLRLYELGQKRLLRKCEAKNFANLVVQIHTLGERIYVGDVSDAFTFARYSREENRLIAIADDTVPRWLTAGQVLDYDTVASADKFGTISLVRLPKETSESVEEDPTGSLLGDRSYLNGAPYRTAPLCSFHLGDTVTTLQRDSLVPGGPEALLYGTVLGGIGALVPFDSREDYVFFQHLEMHMRTENPPLCGRDHIAFRGAYFPVKDVIDGDLCEQFSTLELSKQRTIAQQLDRTPSEIIKKLEDIRHIRLL
jgi:splicing factor 3B subunit 3